MDLKKALLADRTKEYYETLAKQIVADKILLDNLVELVISNDALISNRAAWVISKCADQNITLLKPHISKFISALTKAKSDGVKRNMLRVLQELVIPNKLHGILVDQCFQIMESKKEAIAIKVFAMTVLSNVCNDIPELKNELRIIIEDQLPYGSAGFRSRANKILSKL